MNLHSPSRAPALAAVTIGTRVPPASKASYGVRMPVCPPVGLGRQRASVVDLSGQYAAGAPVARSRPKGALELGLCGVGAPVANATYNATGIHVRDYPITLDKRLAKLPAVA